MFGNRNLVESIEETLAAERMARRHAAELAEAERQGRIQDRAAQQVSQTSPNHVVWRAAEFDRQKGGRCEFVLNEVRSHPGRKLNVPTLVVFV